ncbi:MAG: hypothetical protein K2X25_12630 [Caulobacteraceae bacterium]|nr:hypothetical protein [Caulobacteraceae bacterium]
MRDRPGLGAAMARAHTSVLDQNLEAFSPAVRQRAFRRAESLLAASRTSCDVVNAALLGRTERQRDVVEVACASGLGYILVDGRTPAAFDCLQIAQTAAVVRINDPRANLGSRCRLRENGG